VTVEALLFALIVGLSIVFQPQPEPEPAPPPPPKDRVVLLPGADGRVGKVLISSPTGDTQEIASAYGAMTIDPQGTLSAYTENPEAVRAQHADLLAVRPPLPRSFLLYFRAGGNELTAESLQTLQELKQDAAQRPAPEILVIGHTDRVGSDTANEALSLRRAQAIAERLTGEFGIRPRSLEATGRGELDPLVPTADGVDEPRNRRVEVSIR